jgi:IstB-like ATP binding protein
MENVDLCRRCDTQAVGLCEPCQAIENQANDYGRLRKYGAPKIASLRVALYGRGGLPEWPRTRPWLLLRGKSGTGKTTIAVAFMASGWRFADVVDLIASRKAAISDEEREDPASELANAKSLVVDDLGAERDTEFARDTVEELIRCRYNALAKTVFTTNLDLPDIEKRYGARIAGRIAELAHVAPVLDINHRISDEWLSAMPPYVEHFDGWDNHSRHLEWDLSEKRWSKDVESWEKLRKLPEGLRRFADEAIAKGDTPAEAYAYAMGTTYDPRKDPEVIAELARRNAS